MDEVIEERCYLFYKLQLLEGPTDNPFRIEGPEQGPGPGREWAVIFYIGGPGWEILSKVWRNNPNTDDYDATAVIGSLVSLVQKGCAEELGATLD